MADALRIEIPVEVVNKTDAGTLTKLENELRKIQTSAQQIASAAQTAFGQLGSAATQAGSAMGRVGHNAQQAATGIQQLGSAAQEAGNEAEHAGDEAASGMEQIGDSAKEAAESMKQIGDSAQQAGNEASGAFNQAGSSVDQFTQRVEKSQQSIRKAFGEKIRLVLEALDKVSPILNNVKTSLKNLTAKAWRIAVRMTDFVTAPFRKLVNMIKSPIAMTLTMTGIGMGASSFVTTFKDFTAGMSNVKALSGATNEEFVKLTATAEELGATTKFTATEASEGMQYLAMAGWKTNDIIAAMPGLLDLAAAGNVELGSAADIVSDVMTAMGMSADQAGRAADIFARTATSTNTTVGNLGESLKYAAPAAKAFGLSLSEVSTITGMMANAGIKGSMAGTALRASLLELANPSKKAASAMKSLDLTFANADGTMKDMKTIIGDLSKAFGGLTDQEKLTYAEDIFGTRGSSAWLAVIEQGADEYERLFTAIDESAGAAKEMANTQLDNLQGDITLLNSALDGMKISLMNELNPALREGVQWLTAQVPKITETLTGFATKAIDKLKEVKDRITEVFNSSSFQNADGFAEKFFIAWDKLIAEPFNDWWDNGGQETIIGAVQKIGKGLGDMYHGIISGIFAALKGEEIDFDGMNLTGIAKAGAEAAKSFITAFKEAFDLGGLVGDMPGILKAGLFGFGAMKIGSGTLGVARVVRDLKLAFKPAVAAAAPAAGAVSTVGTAAATGTGIMTKFGAALKVVGAALGHIPVWGWVAAAAIGAVVIGVNAYTKAQKEHEEALLNTGKAAKEYEEQYVETAENIERAMATMGEIKKIELLIEENKGGNAEVIAHVKEELDSILNKKVLVEAQFARGDITKEEYDKLMAEMADKTVQVKAELNKEGYNEATAQLIIDQYNGIAEGQKTITLILAKKTQFTPQEIQEYVDRLTTLMNTKTEKELFIKGSGLTLAQIDQYRTKLEKIKDRKAELELKMKEGQGSMTTAEWNSLVSEYQSLTKEAGEIEIMLKGSEANAEEVKAAKEQVAELKGEAEGILLKLGYAEGSELNQSDLDKMAETLAQIGDHEFYAKVGLENTGMSEEEMQGLIDKQNELYRSMVESSGGVFTQRDVEQGRISQEDFDWWVKDQTTKAENDRAFFNAQVKEDRENIPELVEKREAARAAQTSEEAGYSAVMEDKKLLNDLENQRQAALAAYMNSDKTDADYAALEAAGQKIKEQGQNHKWSDMFGAPMNFETIQPTELFGKMTGGLFDTGLFGHWEADRTVNPFGSAMEELNSQADNWTTRSDEYGQKANEYDEALNRHYQNEVTMATQNATAGLGYESGLTTASIDELAAQYANLDSAAQEAFANALIGIEQLNQQADYVAEEQKVDTVAAIETAQATVQKETNAQIIGDVTANITNLKAQMEALGDAAPDGQFADQISQVSKALSELGIEGIDLTTVEGLQTALNEIAGLDLSTLSFDEAIASLTAFGTSTDETKGKLDAAKTAAENAQEKLASIAGTYTAIIEIKTKGTLPEIAGGNVKKNATGGIYDGAFLSWVAEDGPEAIIPLGSDKRDRGLDLWMQAGAMMGVTEFADGGIMAPYSGLFAEAPDDFWDEEGTPREIPNASPRASGGNNTFTISVEANPTFEVNASDGEDVLDKLRHHQRELAELFGGAIADQMADIVANMI